MRLTTWLLAGGLLALGTAAHAEAQRGEYLIRTTLPEPSAADLTDLLGVAVARVEHVSDDLYKVVTAAPELELRTGVAERADGLITHVQKNFVYRTTLVSPRALIPILRPDLPLVLADDNPAVVAPDASPARGIDPKASAQWGLGKTKANEAWAVQRGSKDVIVAVIDTGVDYNHEDLRTNLWRNAAETAGNGIDDDQNGYVDDVVGWDFADDDAFPWDKMSAQRFDGNPGHGTHCAGVVGGTGNNALGISGVAPNVSIMALRFITDKGEGTTADAVKAIRYAVANGAKVLSNSWGGEKDSEDDTELKLAIEEAQAAGVLLIFAAGNGRNGAGYSNDSDAKPIMPASYDYPAIVSVAATDSADALGSFSNWGTTSVDLAAPGVRVMSSVPNNAYEDKITIFGFPIADWSGTSMAAPHVAGAAALVWSQHPTYTAAQVKARLLDSVTPVAALRTKVKAGGVLNALSALD